MRKFIFSSLMVLLLVGFITSCAQPTDGDITAPVVSSTSPARSATGTPLNGYINAAFSEEMDPTTITSGTFTLAGPATITGSIAINTAGTAVVFTPDANLASNTEYTATITTGAKDLIGNEMANAYVWSFTTGTTVSVSPAPVALGTAGSFVVLAKTGVSTTGTTSVVGDIGLSPAAQSYLTGFSEALDSTNVFATSSLVTGKLYAADMAVPTPANMTTAISDMEIAFTDAAGRTLPAFTELGAGDVSGLTLVPGLYTWGTSLQATSGVTISGGADDVWIFQVAGDLTIGNGVIFTLSGGAMPKNIFWQVAGQTSLGTTADFKGIILCQTKIVMQTGATMNGRALAQTAVTLDSNAVTQPTL